MKKFLKSLIIAIIIVAVAVGLGIVGSVKDQQMFLEKEGEVLGHGMPVYTIVFPLLWLSFWFWFKVIVTIVRFIKKHIGKLNRGSSES